ncbi:MAG TPA: alpha/beta hydrolase-fold protein [Dyella sp.]|uniref:alpha/beta hydrolase n=1 Tax=Dyella sp. TaxID=1869338 RepID=UPI002D76AE96|nr:alpha/beta hydrolase-fold protein [Dyella sp.]HET6552543.1 alpha/beta hydrolase-fold protein [Dyella sp.]
MRPRWLFLASLVMAMVIVSVFSARLALVWQAERKPPIFQVKLDGAATQPVSGRLLLFATPAGPARAAAPGGVVTVVDADAWHPQKAAVAAREIARLAPGQTVEIDTDALAFPTGFSRLPPGEYLLQAVLDQDHNYNYSGRDTGDLISPVVSVRLPAITPTVLKLVSVHARPASWTLPWESAAVRADADDARAHTVKLDHGSALLSAFWGRDIRMHGWVLLPPGYDASSSRRYPTVYFTHGYGGDEDTLIDDVVNVHLAMKQGSMPPMIWVFLDQSTPTGTHEFADSVNNGPWGRALVEELIPWLESRYCMDGNAHGRLLTGHSSGGWATLWLQTHYAAEFGGTWSTSPDPVDFHDFSGVDLYSPHVNLYRRPDGTPWPIDRVHFHAEGSFEDAARLEQVLGPYGGQLSSYEWVFSPRDANGEPMKLFDRYTGDVDPQVRDYWVDHYDIAHFVQKNWPTLKANLDGKIHIAVGTDDTWYLDGAVHKFKLVLDSLHARADIRFLPNKAHMDLYAQGNDPHALLKQMAWEMYAVARPDTPATSTTETASR